jgi:hypothetical protein
MLQDFGYSTRRKYGIILPYYDEATGVELKIII